MNAEAGGIAGRLVHYGVRKKAAEKRKRHA
jgi:hypothetical protein